MENNITQQNSTATPLYNPTVIPEIKQAKLYERTQALDLDGLPLDVYVENIDALSPQEFTLARKEGFGGSDAGVLTGVNPYKTLQELIEEKARQYLTEEEKEIGNITAVRKGNDLEPLIMLKFEKHFNRITFKPSEMYIFKDYPWLKMNFDGVTTIEDMYIPVEIKTVTKTGTRHYNPMKAVFRETQGWSELPTDVSEDNSTIEMKAAHYGIPPYYYAQLQQEIMALDAPYGILAALLESTWELVIFFVWRDKRTQNMIITQGYKAWERVLKRRKILEATTPEESEEPLFIDEEKEEA